MTIKWLVVGQKQPSLSIISYTASSFIGVFV